MVCQWTAVLPVMQSRMALDSAADAFAQAREAGQSAAERKENWSIGLRKVQDAVNADPRDERARRELASRYFLTWLTEGSEQREDQFETALERWLELADRSESAYKQAGDWFLKAAHEPKVTERRGEDDESQGDRSRSLAERAVDAYRRAVDLHPNDSLDRAHLAWAAHLAGQHDLARRQAAEALRLDALTPHRDRKLNYDKLRLADATVADKSPEDVMKQLLQVKSPKTSEN
jgi:tetratricopeptide (TPR) repeat protein